MRGAPTGTPGRTGTATRSPARVVGTSLWGGETTRGGWSPPGRISPQTPAGGGRSEPPCVGLPTPVGGTGVPCIARALVIAAGPACTRRGAVGPNIPSTVRRSIVRTTGTTAATTRRWAVTVIGGRLWSRGPWGTTIGAGTATAIVIRTAVVSTSGGVWVFPRGSAVWSALRGTRRGVAAGALGRRVAAGRGWRPGTIPTTRTAPTTTIAVATLGVAIVAGGRSTGLVVVVTTSPAAATIVPSIAARTTPRRRGSQTPGSATHTGCAIPSARRGLTSWGSTTPRAVSLTVIVSG